MPQINTDKTQINKFKKETICENLCASVAKNSSVTILALGVRQSWRGLIRGGARPDFIVFDDVEKSGDIRNPRIVQERMEFFLRDVRPAMEKGGKMFLVGNLFSRRSAMTRFFEDSLQYPHLRRFRFDAEDSEGNPVWPDKYSKEDLQNWRRDLGEARFNAEYMNCPSDEGTMVKPEDIKYYSRDEISLKKMEIAGFYDPSATSTENSDYQAFITVGRVKDEKNENFIYYVLDAFVKRCKLDDAIASVYQRAKEWTYNLIGAETNVLKEWLEGEFRRAEGAFKFPLPWRGVRNTGEKRERIRRLAPLIERGALRFLRGAEGGDTPLLVEQILFSGSPGVHDDAPDALAGVMEMWAAEDKAEAERKKRVPLGIVFTNGP